MIPASWFLEIIYSSYFKALCSKLFLGEVEQLKSKSFVIQEGCFYQLKIYFYVQREIVTGLKYVQQSYRAGVRGLFDKKLKFICSFNWLLLKCHLQLAVSCAYTWFGKQLVA
jgi:RHO protein GDP dissociation inhibitor